MKKILPVFMLSFLALFIAVSSLAQNATADLIGADPLNKARQLMKVMGVEKTLYEHMSNADDIQRSAVFLVAKIAETNPGGESKINDLLVESARSTLPQIVPGYVEYMANLYAWSFTPPELDQLIGFYKSESMQEVLKKSAESTEVPEMNHEAQDQSNAFLQTPTGKKLQQKSPQIMQKVNMYAVDIARKKQRTLLYEALRKKLPENGLKVPNPFNPDTFIDQTLHDNAVKANALPFAAAPVKPPVPLVPAAVPPGTVK